MKRNNAQLNIFLDLYDTKLWSILEDLPELSERTYMINNQIERLVAVLPKLFLAYCQQTHQKMLISILESIGIPLKEINQDCLADYQKFHCLNTVEDMQNLLNSLAHFYGQESFTEFYLSIRTKRLEQGGVNR